MSKKLENVTDLYIQGIKEGKIEVIFNIEGKRGQQYKTVTLKLNTERKEKTLTIKANVLENNYKS